VSSILLRDAQHAHNLYTQQRLDFSPKVKYLYHCYFDLTPEARFKSPISSFKNNLINVLVKSLNLPSYTSQISTVQQYNRKKNIQTRIDYEPVTFTFHDDMAGHTKDLLKDYYNFYYRDGKKNSGFDYDPLDKFANSVPSYGLDNNFNTPFFKEIKIFQLAKQEWNSYTLINPVVQNWQHSDLDYSDASGITENQLTVMYESVLYDSGYVNDFDTPKGFTAPETGYDNTPSPVSDKLEQFYADQPRPFRHTSNNFGYPTNPLLGRNSSTGAPTLGAIIADSVLSTGGISNLRFPGAPEVDLAIRIANTVRDVGNDPSVLADRILNNPAALNSLVKVTLGTGSFSDSYSSRNFQQYDTLESATQQAIQNEIIGKLVGGDRKIVNLANAVVNAIK
jgi:hypothetical protein